MICEDMCPPSEESKLPGSPADSQLEQMSTESQIAQWNRAPRMSCKQLVLVISYCNHDSICHLLCTLDARMFHGYRYSGVRGRETSIGDTHIVLRCCCRQLLLAERVRIPVHF